MKTVTMPKQVDHEARRRELVEASWDVIAREGIEGTTLRKVAAAADCTTGRIAHYFSGRDELIRLALRTANSAAGKRMVEIAKMESNAHERLRRVIYEGLPLDAARLREWKVWIVFWAAAASNDDLARENARRYKEWQELLSKLISDVSGPDDADVRALTLVSLVDGLGIRAALVPSKNNRCLARVTVDNWIAGL